MTELTGWTPRSPLATNRCLTRRAYELASPLAAGDGADVGMTIDLLRAGLQVREIEIDLDGADETTGLAAQLDRAWSSRTSPGRWPRVVWSGTASTGSSSPAGSPG